MKRIIIFILLLALLSIPVSYAEPASSAQLTETTVRTTEAQETGAQTTSEAEPTLVPVDGGRVVLYIGIAAAVAAAGCAVYFYLRKLSAK